MGEKKRGITNQTIDYIFYTSEDFECTRVLNMPTKKIEPLFMPGWKYPSDHFCIVADLICTSIPVQRKPISKGNARPAARQTRPRGNAVSVARPNRNGNRRRRMAQREFSSRRDSPVMVRLLREIVAAQDAFQPSGRRRRLPWGRSRFGAALGQLGSAVTQVTTP